MKQHREQDQGGKEQGKSAEMIRKRHKDGQREGGHGQLLTKATLIRGESQIETERFDSPAGVEADPKSSSKPDR